MSVLEQERTATENIPGLRNTTATQFVEYLASLSQETRRVPDPYSYSITDKGELFSSVDQCLVKEIKGLDKTSRVGRLEYQALLALEQWAANNREGVMIWVSPACYGVYDKAAFVVSEIEYQNGSKTLLNRKIVLDDFNENQCMKFAWNLTSFSRNKPIFRNSDEIRAIPLVLDTNRNWVDVLEKLIDAPKVWTMIRTGKDKQLKNEALRQATIVQKQFFEDPRLSYSDEARLAVMQMLGAKGGSCPPRSGSESKTAFQAIAGSSVTISSGGIVESDQYGSLEFECPHADCKKTNRRPRGQLIPDCQHCGKSVRC